MRCKLVFCKNWKIINTRVFDRIDGGSRFDILCNALLGLIFVII